MRHPLVLVMLVAALLVAACGAQDTATTAADDAGATAAATDEAVETEAMDEPAETEADDSADAASTVAVTSTDLGEVLVDAEGVTLYLFTNDEQGGDSTCYDDCESSWPPLEGPAEAGQGADDSLLDVVEREDGSQQATYNGWPLYYFAGDEQPGDVNGQGVGGVWFAVTADGEKAGEGGSDDAGARDY